MRELVKNSIVSYLVTSVISVAITVLIFSFSANPVSTDAIRSKLVSMAFNQARMYVDMREAEVASMDSFVSYKVGMDSTESIVGYGNLRNSKGIIGRWLAVFEPKDPNILDKLVGRSGFYKLSFIGFIPAKDDEELASKSIEAKDIDGDGLIEFLVNLESQWGDSKSKGFLILKRKPDSSWIVFGLPDMSHSIAQAINGNIPEVGELHTNIEPITHFGTAGSKANKVGPPSKEIMRNLEVYQDLFSIENANSRQTFSMIKNGGSYKFFIHPIKKYFLVSTVSFIFDKNPVLAKHYCAVAVYSVGKESLVRDINWNWGYPMLSITPYMPQEVEIDSVLKAGIEAHRVGGSLYWYESFERN